jgi:glycogen operon protein
MLLAGDEIGKSQLGNNNAYCQDNDLTWFNWKLTERNEALRRFFATLAAFRRAEPTVRQPDFLHGQPRQPGGLPDVSWFSSSGGQVEWSGDSRSLVCMLGAVPSSDPEGKPNHNVLMLFHAGVDARHFILPQAARDVPWRLFLDTAAENPADIYPNLDGPPPASNGIITLESRSLKVFVAPQPAYVEGNEPASPAGPSAAK